MVITYYIKHFRTGADSHKGILVSLLLLIAETIITESIKMNESRAPSETFCCGLEFGSLRDPKH